ncbi:MAG: NIPSNAP family protein, partial [Acidobacteria bacterium]|nr:NIPSNAP family protein [Acidobacteriota bacterium]
GMTNVGYWVPQDEPASKNTLIYIISHKSREAAKKSWDAFRADPEWKKVQAESEKDGKIVDKVVSVFMTPTDYSKLK